MTVSVYYLQCVEDFSLSNEIVKDNDDNVRLSTLSHSELLIDVTNLTDHLPYFFGAFNFSLTGHLSAHHHKTWYCLGVLLLSTVLSNF